MTKLDDKINKLIRDLESASTEAMSPASMADIAEKIKKQIVNRSKVSSLGVNEDGGLEKFPQNSEKYIKQRKKYKVNLASFAGIKKSNISATGSMLESITYEVSTGFIRFFFRNNSRKTLTGKTSSQSNEEVAAALLDRYDKNLPGGRRFFALSKIDKQTIEGFFRKKLRKFLDSIKK